MDKPVRNHQAIPHGGCNHCEVRDQSFCTVLHGTDLEAFASLTHNKRLQAGEAVVSEGDHAGYFYNLVSGAVRLVKLLPNGRRQILGFLYPGDFIGFATQNSYSYTAETLTESQVCQFDIKSFNSFVDGNSDLKAELLERANNELTVALEQMLLLGRKTPTERLASFLLRLPSDAGNIHLAMTRQDIADYLGLTIETVSRTFSRLKADGLIALPNRATVTILDRNVLVDMAEES